MREVVDVIGIVAGRQELVLSQDIVEKLRRDPYLISQISLSSQLKEEVSAKTAHDGVENLWRHFLAEIEELLPMVFAEETNPLRQFYLSRFEGLGFDSSGLELLPYGDVLAHLLATHKDYLSKGEFSEEQDWRVQWLKFLEGEYFSGSFLAGVLRYFELRYQTVAALSYALLRSERA